MQADVTINGSPIAWIEPDLDRYYRDNVIGGPGAFAITINLYADFADTILDKLVAEIAGRVPKERVEGFLASSARQ